MSLQHITCIVCPKGCALEVDVEAQTVVGNSCPRGYAHGMAEATNPTRALTSTVRAVDQNGQTVELVPVRTAGAIPKALLFDAMAEINAQRVTLPIKRGDTIIPNILGTGVDLIATRDFA
ncbi:MAG: DUF1667 domain-containing protein [Planctomycetia bacterium]|nr:DUF1667 domain-containing protein [Planctomycetia bacterium]